MAGCFQIEYSKFHPAFGPLLTDQLRASESKRQLPVPFLAAFQVHHGIGKARVGMMRLPKKLLCELQIHVYRLNAPESIITDCAPFGMVRERN
ncbi:hypothetical protein D3C84_1091750 [compost metagenome]